MTSCRHDVIALPVSDEAAKLSKFHGTVTTVDKPWAPTAPGERKWVALPLNLWSAVIHRVSYLEGVLLFIAPQSLRRHIPGCNGCRGSFDKSKCRSRSRRSLCTTWWRHLPKQRRQHGIRQPLVHVRTCTHTHMHSVVVRIPVPIS